MGKIRRAGYIFLFWTGDHGPRHVHVYRDGALVTKWDLDHRRPMKGGPPRKVIALIEQLEREGEL